MKKRPHLVKFAKAPATRRSSDRQAVAHSNSPQWIGVAFGIPTLAALAVIVFTSPILEDGMFWRYFQDGQLILQGTASTPAVTEGWLSKVLLAKVFVWGGVTAVQWLFFASLLTSLFLLGKWIYSRTNNHKLAALISAFGLVFLRTSFSPTVIFGSFALSVWVFTWLSFKSINRTRLGALALLTLIGINIDFSVVAILPITLVSLWFSRKDRASWRIALLWPLLLANPNFAQPLRKLLSSFVHFSLPFSVEGNSLLFRLSSTVLPWAFIIWGWCLALRLADRRSTYRREFALFSVGLILSLTAPWISGIVLLCLGLATLFLNERLKKEIPELALRPFLLNAAIFTTLIFYLVTANGFRPVFRAPLPRKAMEILATAKLRGVVWNEPGWGGFIERSLTPRVTSVQGVRPIPVVIDADLLVHASIDERIGNLGPQWITIFENNVSVVSLRRDSDGGENLRKIADYYSIKHLPFDAEKGFHLADVYQKDVAAGERLQDSRVFHPWMENWTVAYRILRESRFYESRGLLGKAMELVRQGLEMDTRSEAMAIRLGELLVRAGDWDQATKWFSYLDASSMEKQKLIPLRVALYERQRLLGIAPR